LNTRKPLAVFRSTLPDDSVENSHGDIVVPAGRNILQRICGSLNSQGYVIAGIEQYCFYGWETSFEIEGIKIWMLLQCPGPVGSLGQSESRISDTTEVGPSYSLDWACMYQSKPFKR